MDIFVGSGLAGRGFYGLAVAAVDASAVNEGVVRVVGYGGACRTVGRTGEAATSSSCAVRNPFLGWVYSSSGRLLRSVRGSRKSLPEKGKIFGGRGGFLWVQAVWGVVAVGAAAVSVRVHKVLRVSRRGLAAVRVPARAIAVAAARIRRFVDAAVACAVSGSKSVTVCAAADPACLAC